MNNPLLERRDYTGENQLDKNSDEIVSSAVENSLEGKIAHLVSRKRRDRNPATKTNWDATNDQPVKSYELETTDSEL